MIACIPALASSLICRSVLCTLANACIQGRSYDNNFLLGSLLKTDLSQNGHLAAVKLFGQIQSTSLINSELEVNGTISATTHKMINYYKL